MCAFGRGLTWWCMGGLAVSAFLVNALAQRDIHGHTEAACWWIVSAVSTAEAALYVREAKALLGHLSVRVVGGRCLRAIKISFAMFVHVNWSSACASSW